MPDTQMHQFEQLKAKARAVKSRHPLAVAARKQGGRGSARKTAAAPRMIPPASANPTQKASATCDTTPLQPYSPDATSPAVAAILPQSDANPGISTCIDDKSPLNAKDGVLGAVLPGAETADAGPWGDGSLRCAVYCRPLNPRILLVSFPGGGHGRIVCHPKERARFCPGDELWCKPAAGKDIYILAGRYNRRGLRVR